MIIVNVRANPRRTAAPQPDEPYFGSAMVNWRLNTRPHIWRPPTDLYETEDRYVIRVEIAGMSEADFDLSLDQSILTIAGVRPDPANERRAFHRLEISYGEFITQVELPADVNRDAIEADYTDGFLRVVLPKARPKQISVTKEA